MSDLCPVAMPRMVSGAELNSCRRSANAVEWLFGEGGIRSQLRQQEIIGPDHLQYRRRRAGELGQNDIE